MNPVDIFNAQTSTWTEKPKPPLEIHHFEVVTVNNLMVYLSKRTLLLVYRFSIKLWLIFLEKLFE
jgi:hypothetical protein